MIPSKITNLGAVTAFEPTTIYAALTNTAFLANSGVAFTSLDPVGINRTFVALNDNIDGFSASTDALVEITGYTGSLDNLLLG